MENRQSKGDMMNRGFREDENELPYLVSEKRDKDNSNSGRRYEKPQSIEERIEEIVYTMPISYSQSIALKRKLISFMNRREVTNLTVENSIDYYDFIFTRQNEYISTTHSFEYDTRLELDRIFRECYTTHNYDNLLKNSRFKELIRKTGFEFLKCSGGYVIDYTFASDDFKMKDELELNVWFRVGSNDRVYKLDLDKMELSENYFEYDSDDYI